MRQIAFVLLALFGGEAVLANTSPVEQHNLKQLSESTQWHRLLHYEQGRKMTLSLADDGQFFLSPRGHIDPLAELKATLAAFAETRNQNSDDHPQCRFPARFAWLDQTLKISQNGISTAPCKRLNGQLDALGDVELKFIFSDAYMGNPASMFGHTLMRIDPINKDGSMRDKPLLNHAIDFAGFTDGVTGGFGYALAGLTGGYPGYYQVIPFYEKVKKYTFDDSRDLWEYTLDLNQQQARMLLLHLWELDRIRFDYFFLDENCSYQLLALIEAAMPEVRLTSQFTFTAIPPDVVRALDDAKLIKRVTFRPSRDTTLAFQSNAASPAVRTLAVQLAEGKRTPSKLPNVSLTEQAQSLELAYALLDRKQRQGDTSDAISERSNALLLARSKLDITKVFPAVPTPSNNPAASHGAARFGLGAAQYNGDLNTVLHARFALHDVLDPYLATVPGGQIRILDAQYHRSHDKQRSYLYDFTLVNLSSLAPKAGLIEPGVFRLSAGFHRTVIADAAPDQQPLSFYVSYGRGLSRRLQGKNLLAYAMADINVDADRKLDKGFLANVNAEVGILHNSASLNSHLTASWSHDIAGQAQEKMQVRLGQQWNITPQVGIRWFGEWQSYDSHEEQNAGISLMLYQ